MNARSEPTTFIALTPAMRQLIENVVEDLLLLLDELDGDPDLEPTMGDVPEGYLDEQEGDDPDAEDDDPAEDDDGGLADYEGLMEQTNGLRLGA